MTALVKRDYRYIEYRCTLDLMYTLKIDRLTQIDNNIHQVDINVQQS